MRIDGTRFKAFLRNPEYFRLKYVKNLTVPDAEIGYGLQRGTGFHILQEGDYAGLQNGAMEKLLKEHVSSKKAQDMARSMHKAFKKHYNPGGPKVLQKEVEFCFKMPDSPHEMAGRIDEILQYKSACWCGETKTANRKADYTELKHQWRFDPQADFEILGARSWGYQPVGVLVRTITEHVPPKIWEIEVVRDEAHLKLFMHHVHAVCEQIKGLTRILGPDQPWPHNGWAWPCSKPGTCEFGDVCGKLVIPPRELARFVVRKEHLKVMEK